MAPAIAIAPSRKRGAPTKRRACTNTASGTPQAAVRSASRSRCPAGFGPRLGVQRRPPVRGGPCQRAGALLLVAGTDIAMSKRLFDARPACLPAIGIAAAATTLLNPMFGLAAGWAVEAVRAFVAHALRRLSEAA
jgi:hypothetical protein